MLEEENQQDCETCQFRKDGKCIGADKCLRESDIWIQNRVLVKLTFFRSKDTVATSANRKDPHSYYHDLKLSEGLGLNREAFLDNLINARKKCAFEKFLKEKRLSEKLPDETDDPEMYTH